MKLQEMVKEVRRLHTDAVVVTFNNNVARVYERREEGIIADDVSPDLGFHREPAWNQWQLFDGGYPTLIHDQDFVGYFSRETNGRVQELAEQNYFPSQQLNQATAETFTEVVRSLDLQLRTGRDWKFIGSGLGLGVLSPVLTPLGLLASMVVGGQRNGTGPNLAMMSLAPPVMGYQAVRELIQPRSQYLELGKKDLLTNENSDSYPAFFVNGSPRRFTSMGLLFPTGDIGNVFPAYKPEEGEDLIMASMRPTGHALRNYEQRQYQQAKQFLKLESNLNEKMNSLLHLSSFP